MAPSELPQFIDSIMSFGYNKRMSLIRVLAIYSKGSKQKKVNNMSTCLCMLAFAWSLGWWEQRAQCLSREAAAGCPGI